MKSGDLFLSKLAVLNTKLYPDNRYDLWGAMVYRQDLRLDNKFPGVPIKLEGLVDMPLRIELYDKVFNKGNILDWAI